MEYTPIRKSLDQFVVKPNLTDYERFGRRFRGTTYGVKRMVCPAARG